MTWEGKLECFFWTKGCCGIGVWRDLWSLYSGQSRRRIGFPECFALTLCSPSTAGKRPHLPDTHTHTHTCMQSLIIESKTRLWRSRAEALMRKKSHAPSLHSFICTSLQLRRKEKEERSGHSEEVDSTTLIHREMGRETAFEGEKESWFLGNCPKKIYIRSDWFGTLFISINSKWHTKVVVLTKSHKRCDSRLSPIKSNFSKLLS